MKPITHMESLPRQILKNPNLDNEGIIYRDYGCYHSVSPSHIQTYLIRSGEYSINEQADTIIIGAGHSGLGIGYCLAQRKRSFIIIEKGDALTPAWRSRWDSFTLVLPNWTLQLPGYAYQGDDPDGFLNRDEMVRYMEGFAATFQPDIRFGSQVTSIEKAPDGGKFLVCTKDHTYQADHVIVATGTYQAPRLPAFQRNISDGFTQLHTSQYHNPDQLPEGSALVVGSGQSGCQIAEELYKSGRKVYLCVGGAIRLPRTYRGKDSVMWLSEMGFFDMTVDKLSSPREKFVANPFLTGKDGGHSLDLHQFAKDEVVLLGRMRDAQGSRIFLAPTLMESLAKIDNFVADVTGRIDQYIEKNHIAAESAPVQAPLKDGYAAQVIVELDLHAAGIKSIIWATGYKFDYSLVKFPVFDEDGYPVQTRGVSEVPGLYFVGMHFLYKRKSGLPWGIAADAEYIAEHIQAHAG
jgi:putative flavoprotein involved in K+ transport